MSRFYNEEFDDFDNNESVDEIAGKEILSLKEYEALQKKSRLKRRIAAAVHFIVVLALLVACSIIFDDILIAAVAYLIGYFILHLIMQHIPDIGYYKPGYYEYVDRNGDTIKVADENYEKFYGFGSILKDVFFEVIAAAVLLSFSAFVLPLFIFGIAIITAVAFLVIKYIAMPLIADIINMISAKDRRAGLETARSVVGYAVIFAGVVALIGAYIVFPNILPERLDKQALIEEYYETKELPSPFFGFDYDECELTFKEASTVCIMKHEGEFVYENGIKKQGAATVEFYFNMEEWRVKSISAGYSDMQVSSPVSFAGVSEEAVGDYEAGSVFCATLESYDGEAGSGVFTVSDKATGAVEFSTPFTIGLDFAGNPTILLETALDVGYFGYGELELTFDSDKNSIFLEAIEVTLVAE